MALTCVNGVMECTGCMDCMPDDPQYDCPVCGAELGFDDAVYRDGDGDVIGCCECVESVSAGAALMED